MKMQKEIWKEENGKTSKIDEFIGITMLPVSLPFLFFSFLSASERKRKEREEKKGNVVVSVAGNEAVLSPLVCFLKYIWLKELLLNLCILWKLKLNEYFYFKIIN